MEQRILPHLSDLSTNTFLVRVEESSSIATTSPLTSVITASPLGLRASKISWIRGRPCV